MNDRRTGKGDDKAKVEQLLENDDAREAWCGLKTMVGLNSQRTNSAQTMEFANDLNCVFARYETPSLIFLCFYMLMFYVILCAVMYGC